EAREWFGRTAEIDLGGQTDAADQVLALGGVVMEDLGVDEDGIQDGLDEAALAAYIAEGMLTPVETSALVVEEEPTRTVETVAEVAPAAFTPPFAAPAPVVKRRDDDDDLTLFS
ncbi:MAG: hypothetical protein H7323_16235, partial [Frankiales bacterium]|nr:hypothetical protein [Frankiales bacterium]